ncbi:OmpH family outer membrane protein [Legionella fairfieldensis]|uniref:OmpH family outer membrane protein n=1 Tax=Legionella fairfieldensis TaxID=45064 RepID=UPI00048DBEB8|nr:OmpH family outer membrane protein [Legionella fairfieldensis]
MKRLSGILIAFVLSACGFNAVAYNAVTEGVKIGVVDLQKIMQTSPQMKAIQQKLEKDFKPRRDKLVAMEEGLKQDMEKFKRDSAVMSDTQKKDLEKKIMTTQQTFEREGQQYQQELSTAHNEAMEDLYGKIRKAIANVAQTDKYDIVLQKDAAPFSSDKLDITDSVIKQIS